MQPNFSWNTMNAHMQPNFNTQINMLDRAHRWNDNWINDWYNYKCSINRRNDTQKIKTVLGINYFKMTMRECINHITTISALETKLRNNITSLSNKSWSEETTRVEEIKCQLSRLIETIDDEMVHQLKKKLKKRNSKRLRIKQKKKDRKLKYEEKIKERTEKHRLIDQKLQQLKKKREKALQEEEKNNNADMVLRNVRRKKTDSLHNLALLESLIKLRNARKATKTGRGEKLADDDKSFYSGIEKLTMMWTERLKSYKEEEKQLRGLIEKEKEKEPLDRSAEAMGWIEQWRQLLFGEKGENFQRDFKGNWQHFVSVRKEWDRYICDSEKGSSLPAGWVIPQL